MGIFNFFKKPETRPAEYPSVLKPSEEILNMSKSDTTELRPQSRINTRAPRFITQADERERQRIEDLEILNQELGITSHREKGLEEKGQLGYKKNWDQPIV